MSNTTYLIHIDLVRNAIATSDKGFVAKIKDGEIEFLKAVVPEFDHGVMVAGKYLLSENDVLIIKRDNSSHKNKRTVYSLTEVKNGVLNEIAYISIVNRNMSFSDEKLESIYIDLKVNKAYEKSIMIESLIRYYKSLKGESK